MVGPQDSDLGNMAAIRESSASAEGHSCPNQETAHHSNNSRTDKLAEAAEALAQELRALSQASGSAIINNTAKRMSKYPPNESQTMTCCSTVFALVDDLIDHCREKHNITEISPRKSSATLASSTDDLREPWQPLAVSEMTPVDSSVLSRIPDSKSTATFSWEFLYKTFRGVQWSPSFYWASPVFSSVQRLPLQAYYILDADFEPFLPAEPCMHGAKLTAVLNDGEFDNESPPPEAFNNAPVFIARNSGSNKEYIYNGNYSQTRFSDKLDYDRMVSLPSSVKTYWARQLASPHRPHWVTEKLKRNFWPPPTPAVAPLLQEATGQTSTKDVKQALSTYVNELRAWDRDAGIRVALLKSSDLLSAFEESDAAAEPGLRFWWEYLECVGYDRGFYEQLCELKAKDDEVEKQKMEAKTRSTGGGAEDTSDEENAKGADRKTGTQGPQNKGSHKAPDSDSSVNDDSADSSDTRGVECGERDWKSDVDSNDESASDSMADMRSSTVVPRDRGATVKKPITEPNGEYQEVHMKPVGLIVRGRAEVALGAGINKVGTPKPTFSTENKATTKHVLPPHKRAGSG